MTARKKQNNYEVRWLKERVAKQSEQLFSINRVITQCFNIGWADFSILIEDERLEQEMWLDLELQFAEQYSSEDFFLLKKLLGGD